MKSRLAFFAAFGAVLVAASALLVSAGVASAQQPIVIKFSHVVAVDTPKGKGAEYFKKLAEIALTAAGAMQRFGIPPRVAFLSHSVFGSSQRASAKRMRAARDLFVARAPHIPCDGEMQGDAALSETVRQNYLPGSTLTGDANLLVLPNLDAANILFNVLKMTGGHGITIGPVLLGAAKPAHVLTPSATVRRVVNMTALAVADLAAQ